MIQDSYKGTIHYQPIAQPLPSATIPFYNYAIVAMGYRLDNMAKAGRKSEAKLLEGKLLRAWHAEGERDNSIKARAKRGIELGSIRAVERMLQLMDSDDERIAFASAREVLQRNFGMPKQDVSLAVTDTSAAHHAALKNIYDKAVARLAAKENAPPIDKHAQVVEAIDIQPESDIATVQIEQTEPET